MFSLQGSSKSDLSGFLIEQGHFLKIFFPPFNWKKGSIESEIQCKDQTWKYFQILHSVAELPSP